MPSSLEHAYPVSLSPRGRDELVIAWSDGQQRVYRWAELRQRCPCADCREKRAQPPPLLSVLSPAEAQPPQPRRMTPVGNYAYHIEWNDGHSTGIYSFELLRQWGTILA